MSVANALIDERTIKPEPIAKEIPPARGQAVAVSNTAAPTPAASAPPVSSSVETSPAAKQGKIDLNIPVPEAPPVATETKKSNAPQPQERVAIAPVSKGNAGSGSMDASMSSPAWQGEYPGPFGNMRLSEALIAQFAPVMGGAIELDVPEKMLSMSVTLNTGMTRQVTIQDMARVSKITVSIAGKKVIARPIEKGGSGTSPTQSVTGVGTEKKVEEINGMTITTISAQSAVSTPVLGESAASSAPATLPLTTNAKKVGAQIDQPINTSRVVQPAIAQPVIAEPIKVTKRWSLPAGTMLSAAMEKWAKAWGWKIMWKVDKDFRIASTVEIDDDFLGGITRVLEAYKTTNHPLWGDAHEGQKLLVITAADGNAQAASSR